VTFVYYDDNYGIKENESKVMKKKNSENERIEYLLACSLSLSVEYIMKDKFTLSAVVK